MKLPHHIVKKDGHAVRFSKAKLTVSLMNAARHAGFDDDAALTTVLNEVFTRIGDLDRETITVRNVREIISGTLKERGLSELAEGYDLTFLHIRALRVQKVQKLNGRYDDFRPYNIFKSLVKSFRDAGVEHPGQEAAELTKEIVEAVDTAFAHRTTPTTREIKRLVEQTLERRHLEKVLDAYRMHRYL